MQLLETKHTFNKFLYAFFISHRNINLLQLLLFMLPRHLPDEPFLFDPNLSPFRATTDPTAFTPIPGWPCDLIGFRQGGTGIAVCPEEVPPRLLQKRSDEQKRPRWTIEIDVAGSPS